MRWQLQEAKQRFSALVQRALDEGPQVVTRHGKDVVVVLALEDYKQQTSSLLPFNKFLLEGPNFDELEIARDQNPTREVEP
jgi:prevent-host-death family protein